MKTGHSGGGGRTLSGNSKYCDLLDWGVSQVRRKEGENGRFGGFSVDGVTGDDAV